MRDTIDMAREAGMKASRGKTDKDGNYHPFINALGKDVPIEWIEAFEALVRADEREACLGIAESKRYAPNFQLTSSPPQNGTAVGIAAAIRERGNT